MFDTKSEEWLEVENDSLTYHVINRMTDSPIGRQREQRSQKPSSPDTLARLKYTHTFAGIPKSQSFAGFGCGLWGATFWNAAHKWSLARKIDHANTSLQLDSPPYDERHVLGRTPHSVRCREDTGSPHLCRYFRRCHSGWRCAHCQGCTHCQGKS
jgi:hypothetical protein